MHDDPIEKRRFDIQHCLGRGGFGEVYLANMISTGGVQSEVALKILHQGLDPRSQAIQRLRDEAKLLGMLNHPHILRIIDLVMLEGRVSLVSEFIDGLDFDYCCTLGDDPLPLRGRLQVVAKIADALHAAYHRTGPDGAPLHLVHRDIKPSNIRVGRHGEVKLLDFGIAKAATQREAQTQTHAVIGSFPYMAPERLDDESLDSSAGDVFALGCTLYEALTGEGLFEEQSVRGMYSLSMREEPHQTFIRERIARHDLPDDVVAVLLETLAYLPEDRPTVADLGTRLEDLADDQSGPTLSRWCRGHDWPALSTEEGELTGRTVTESSILSASMVPDAVPAPGPALAAPPSAPPAPPPEPVASPSTDAPPPAAARGVSPTLLAIAASALMVLVGAGSLAGVMALGGAVWLTDTDTDTEPAPPTEVPEPAPDDGAGDGDDEGPVGEPEAPVPDAPVAPSPPTDGAPPSDDAPPAAPEPGEADPTVGEGLEACGPLLELEAAALTAALEARQRACLAHVMRDPARAQTERDKLGRVLIVDARARCDAGDCGAYEAEQRYFFEEIGRSDADMLFAFAQHLTTTAETGSQRAEALTWTHRAIERRSAWTGPTHVQRTTALFAQRAQLAYALWTDAPGDGRAQTAAKNHAIEWMNYLNQLGRDSSQALALCASVTGSEDTCRKRAYDIGAQVAVTFLSRPIGAEVFVDGTQVGKTPKAVELKTGDHQVKMVLDDTTSEWSIAVGEEEPTRWTWSRSDDAWSGSR